MPADGDTKKAWFLHDAVAHAALIEIGRISHLGACMMTGLLPREMTVAQYAVLFVMQSAERPMKITQIADLMHVSQPTMSSTVRKLERKQLVKIVPSTTDRRAKHVELTELGVAVKQECDASVSPDLNSIASTLTSEEWKQMAPILKKLRRSYVAALADTNFVDRDMMPPTSS
ncbi:MarR family winged helix-turn-helix transcriptional regulator [Henriciella litoralis]|uniref:MarR family winged helix-turn-helix transcriptional regulator n=1 Tax=Henriciella litoralis TaxID=568102 RepID=UPI000A06C1A3|nr:MarR family transcriptional regulator [Henriciella litoralis]